MLKILMALVAVLIVGDSLDPAPADAKSRGCDRTAGKGADPGAFVKSLRAGQTGCLQGRTYTASKDGVKFSRPNVTLTSRPGSRATLVGRVWIAEGANGVTVRNLKLDGRNAKNQASPVVNANKATFYNNEVTNRHTGICFLLGHDDFGRASGTVIRHNRIHDCGRLPATNHEHGIYVAFATGTKIIDNRIYRNANRGVQLYPDADRTLVTGNVISRNGQGIIFSGSSKNVSENNLVKGNVIKNSRLRFNVESNWLNGRVGGGNVLRGNCIFGGVKDEGNGGIKTPILGFAARNNTIRQSRCR